MSPTVQTDPLIAHTRGDIEVHQIDHPTHPVWGVSCSRETPPPGYVESAAKKLPHPGHVKSTAKKLPHPGHVESAAKKLPHPGHVESAAKKLPHPGYVESAVPEIFQTRITSSELRVGNQFLEVKTVATKWEFHNYVNTDLHNTSACRD